MLKNILESFGFRLAILIVIIINSALLGLETSKYLNDNFKRVLIGIDDTCIIIFVIEILLRIYAYRFEFFTNDDKWWNIFDFIIVVISVFAIEFSVLRALRVFRVFRILSSTPTIRLVCDAVLKTIPGMLGTMFLISVFYYIYAILAINFFSEKFPEFFGDLGKASYSLFQIMSMDGGTSLTREVMKVYPFAGLFFVSFAVIVGFVAINLIIGIIVTSIEEIKEKDKETNIV